MISYSWKLEASAGVSTRPSERPLSQAQTKELTLKSRRYFPGTRMLSLLKMKKTPTGSNRQGVLGQICSPPSQRSSTQRKTEKARLETELTPSLRISHLLAPNEILPSYRLSNPLRSLGARPPLAASMHDLIRHVLPFDGLLADRIDLDQVRSGEEGDAFKEFVGVVAREGGWVGLKDRRRVNWPTTGVPMWRQGVGDGARQPIDQGRSGLREVGRWLRDREAGMGPKGERGGIVKVMDEESG